MVSQGIAGLEVRRLTPELLESRPRLWGQVERFETRRNGGDAEKWLRSEALDAYPAVVTHLFLVDGRLEAFLSLRMGEVELNQAHRKRVRSGLKHPTQGCVLVVWTAKALDATIEYQIVVDYAVYLGRRAVESVGAVALALDPHNKELADHWLRSYGFSRSQTTAKSELRRVWFPLFV